MFVDSSRTKPVVFDDATKEYLIPDAMIQFWKGIDTPKKKVLVGKVLRTFTTVPSGQFVAECSTDFGVRIVPMNRIKKIYVAKTKLKVKETYINSVTDGMNNTPVLDGVVNKIINTVKNKINNLTIDDQRVNRDKIFYRKTTFRNEKNNYVAIEILNNNCIGLSIQSDIMKNGTVKVHNNKVYTYTIVQRLKQLANSAP